jgi:hypothetical protein
MIRLLCAAALLVPAAALAGETPVPAKTAPATSAAADDGGKICKRVTTIGSNVPGKKVCVSKREYEEAQRAGREEAKQLTGSGGGHASGN